MSSEQERIADAIMQHHITNRYVDWEYQDYDHWHDDWNEVKIVLEQLIEDGLLRTYGNDKTRIGTKADGYTTYQNFRLREDEDKKKVQSQSISIIAGGDVIGIGNAHSSVNSLKSERNDITNTTRANSPINKSLISKTAKIIIAILGAIASLVAIYEFIIKQFL